MSPRGQRWVLLALLLVLLLISASLLPREAVWAWLEAPGGVGVALSLALMVLASLTAFPTEAVALANGAIYGPVAGTALTWGGAMLGAHLAHALALRLAPPLPPRWAALQQAVSEPGTLLTIRLIPLFPFFLVNYACGLAQVGRWRFFWTTGLGILPLSVLLSGLGERAAQDPRWLLALAALAALMALLARRRRRRPPPASMGPHPEDQGVAP